MPQSKQIIRNFNNARHWRLRRQKQNEKNEEITFKLIDNNDIVKDGHVLLLGFDQRDQLSQEMIAIPIYHKIGIQIITNIGGKVTLT